MTALAKKKRPCQIGRILFILLWASILPSAPLPKAGGENPSSPLQRIAAVPAGAVRSGNTAILIDPNGQTANALFNLSTMTSWLEAPSRLFAVDSDRETDIDLTLSARRNGAIELCLLITNLSAQPTRVTVTFPLLQGLSPGGNKKDLSYCFPRAGGAFGSEAVELSSAYGSQFPLQFLDVYHPAAGGICVMTHDTRNGQKTYRLTKQDLVEVAVDYPARTLGPGETWRLPAALIFSHAGDWHEALIAYRRWLKTWYRPALPRQPWFRETFNLRQVFLHHNLGAPGAFDPETKQYHLSQKIKEDQRAFGGVDYVHLFDWSLHPQRGRVGDYDPWDHLGGIDNFRSEISRMQMDAIHVGLYLEGYLLSPQSQAAQNHGQSWQMLDSQGEPYTRMGDYVYACPSNKSWRRHLIACCLRAIEQTGADGIYIDEFGFGWQYPCYQSAHGHEAPSPQIQTEAKLLAELREALPAQVVLYTEETPNDFTTQYLDGSFTYALAQSRHPLNPARINLTRFALPQFKMFEIIRCDQPLGNDLDAVRSVFFNGEGIWLEGPLSRPEWFPPAVRRLITRCYRVLQEHKEAFCSADPTPLTPTLRSDVYANRFPARNKVVWTLLNASDKSVEGELLSVAHVPNTEYWDGWHRRKLRPRMKGNRAFISSSLKPKEVGCIVQRQPNLREDTSSSERQIKD